MDDSFKTRWRLQLVDQFQIIKEQTRFTGKQILVVIVLAIAMATGGLLLARDSRMGVIEPEKTVLRRPARKTVTLKKKKIYVHVSGAIAFPGLYEIDSGSRVDDAVKVAGGLLEESDMLNINLAAKLIDGQKVTIPLKGASSDSSGPAPDEADQDDRLNINTATAEALESLNGIGPVLAKRIIAWRVSHGGFKRVRQLDDVTGIGIKKFSQLKDHIKVE